jgi:murein L,D-transpeptidase YcbB/YkuD
LNAADVLVKLSSSNDVAALIASAEPQFVHYRLLKQALARYRLLSVDAQLTDLPAFKGRSIKPGESYAGAPALRKLLLAEQDLPEEAVAADSDTTLDAALVSALQAYQTRHGLPADGALGKRTFVALTTPFAKRVEQIELTLERWRWLPAPQAPMIVVNIPQFKLFAFQSADDHESSLLRMGVIVGQAFPHTQTPVFFADMKYVVFRPYWDVPLSIARRETLPNIQRRHDYLQRNHFELVRGQGDNSPVVAATPENIAQLASGAVRVRQLPGDDNALGEIKFMLPNSYNVYLHSTPAKRLFDESSRAYSHGCIRVSDPTALAEYVLRHAETPWDKQRIEAAMNGEPNQRVYLNKPIPVMIMYGTAMPLESGVVQFFDDIYGHDAKLAKLL